MRTVFKKKPNLSLRIIKILYLPGEQYSDLNEEV